jgi:SMP-30/Gluconolactonase/LRE-like region
MHLPVLLAAAAAIIAVPQAAPGTTARPPQRPAPPTISGPEETSKAKPVFRFRSRGAVGFRCSFDATPLHRCGSRYSQRLGSARHILRVVAVGLSGARSPARFHVVVIGPPSLRFVHPALIAFEPGGTLLVVESGLHRVMRVDPATGATTRFAGTGREESTGDGGPASAAGVGRPFGVAACPSGDVYLTNEHRLRRVDSSGRISTSTIAEFGSDAGPVTCDANGNVFVATHAQVFRFDTTGGRGEPYAGTGEQGGGGDGGPALSAQIDTPHSLAIAPGGALLIADTLNNRVRRIDAVTHVITTVSRVDEVFGLAIGPDGATYVSQYRANRVRRIAPSGAATTVVDRVHHPLGIAFDAAGTLYVVEGDSPRSRIWRVRNGVVTIVPRP